MATTDPLLCVRCKHPIEDHRPGDYNKDACVGLGYRKSPLWGVNCPCEGFRIKVGG